MAKPRRDLLDVATLGEEQRRASVPEDNGRQSPSCDPPVSAPSAGCSQMAQTVRRGRRRALERALPAARRHVAGVLNPETDLAGLQLTQMLRVDSVDARRPRAAPKRRP